MELEKDCPAKDPVYGPLTFEETLAAFRPMIRVRIPVHEQFVLYKGKIVTVVQRKEMINNNRRLSRQAKKEKLEREKEAMNVSLTRSASKRTRTRNRKYDTEPRTTPPPKKTIKKFMIKGPGAEGVKKQLSRKNMRPPTPPKRKQPEFVYDPKMFTPKMLGHNLVKRIQARRAAEKDRENEKAIHDHECYTRDMMLPGSSTTRQTTQEVNQEEDENVEIDVLDVSSIADNLESTLSMESPDGSFVNFVAGIHPQPQRHSTANEDGEGQGGSGTSWNVMSFDEFLQVDGAVQKVCTVIVDQSTIDLVVGAVLHFANGQSFQVLELDWTNNLARFGYMSPETNDGNDTFELNDDTTMPHFEGFFGAVRVDEADMDQFRDARQGYLNARLSQSGNLPMGSRMVLANEDEEGMWSDEDGTLQIEENQDGAENRVVVESGPEGLANMTAPVGGNSNEAANILVTFSRSLVEVQSAACGQIEWNMAPGTGPVSLSETEPGRSEGRDDDQYENGAQNAGEYGQKMDSGCQTLESEDGTHSPGSMVAMARVGPTASSESTKLNRRAWIIYRGLELFAASCDLTSEKGRDDFENSIKCRKMVFDFAMNLNNNFTDTSEDPTEMQ